MDPSIAGRVGTPFEMTIETGKVREFARAVKASDEAHFTDEPVAPATFLVTSTFWSGPENAAWAPGDLNLARVLHGEQEFVFHGDPPVAGTRLVGTARIADIYSKEGKRGGSMQFGETVIEFRDPATGALVAESRSTLIETSKSTTES